MLLKSATFVLAAAVCAVVAWSLAGTRGLEGAAVGIGLGAVLCTLSYLLTRWARSAQGARVYLAAYSGVFLSFAFVVGTLFVLSKWWSELLQPAILTLLVVYLSFRFHDVLQCSRCVRVSPGRIVGGADTAEKEHRT